MVSEVSRAGDGEHNVLSLLLGDYPDVSRIFIVEGLATVVIGLILPFILPDSPDRAKFMTQQEKAFYVRRLQLDYNTGGTDSEGYKNKYLWQALKDWKIYLITVVFCGNSVPVYG